MDPAVDRWKHRANIAMWMQKGKWKPEWNFTADDDACDSLVELLDLMVAAKWPSRKELHLVRLYQTPDGAADLVHPLRFASRLRIHYPKGRVPEDHWTLAYERGVIAFEIGESWLAKFREAIVDIKKGNGDYSIRPGGEGLWVWWWIATIESQHS